MNIVLVCNRTVRKHFEDVLKDITDCQLLSTQTAIKSTFIKDICDNYNPHIVIIVRGVHISESIDFNNTLVEFRKRSSARIIYVYGDMSDNDTQFEPIYQVLTQNNIYDIIIGQKTTEEFSQIISNPMTYEQLTQILENKKEELTKQSEPEADNPISEIQEQINAQKISLKSIVTAHQEFDIMDIDTVSENIPLSAQEELKNITIGVTSLIHHTGCTHTSLEIATILLHKNKNVCVIISNYNTYECLAKHYGLSSDTLSEGFILQQLNIYPAQKFSDVSKKYNYIIYDFGVIGDEQKKLFSSMLIKIMICSSAEWDLSKLLEYVNYTQDIFSRQINYCFYPISQPVFIKYNKQLIKGKCLAYRLQTSNDWHSPCATNNDVYINILKRYTNILPKKKGVFPKLTSIFSTK